MKIGMVIVLMVATYAAAFIAYQVTSSGEEWQFETTYYDNANNIINAIKGNLEETIASLDAFGG